MCDFCHAPEHAYDVLLEDAEPGPSGLCREAQERLLMAATPRPRLRIWHYAWDAETHDWRIQFGNHACLLCDAYRLHKLPDDDAWSLCRKCRENGVERIAALRLHFDGAPLDDAEQREIATPLRRVRRPPTLVFNKTAIATTRGLDGLPGPRAYQPVRYPPEYLAGAKDPHALQPRSPRRRRGRRKQPALQGVWPR